MVNIETETYLFLVDTSRADVMSATSRRNDVAEAIMN